MYAATKILHTGHLVAAKVLTGKAILSASVLASTVATGYVVKSGVPPEYVTGAAVLLDAATLADASHVDPERSAGAAAQAADADARTEIDPALPQMVVYARRLDWTQRAQYDAQKKAAARLAEK